MIKVSAQTFSTANCKKPETYVRPSDLYDNLPRERERKSFNEHSCWQKQYNNILIFYINAIN